jgi:ketosteroid isomerase-like protein
MEPAAVVERYLDLIADPAADLAAIGELLDAGMRFIERPNLISPGGSERDAAQVLEAVVRGRELLREQRLEILDRVVAGDMLAARVRWTGTLATTAGSLPAGARLEAHSSMWFTVRGGRIVRQENYDCFTAPSPP